MSRPVHNLLEVPVIETERTFLRGHRAEDFAGSLAMWGEPEVTRFIGGKPLTEQECWARLLRYVGHWALLGFGYWLVEEKSSRDFVGEAGFADYKRGLEPSLCGVPEIGWALRSQFHGQGYATEVVRAVVSWGDAHFPSGQTFCIIDPENLPSIRVAAKCGYQESLQTTYKGHPTTIHTRNRSLSKSTLL